MSEQIIDENAWRPFFNEYWPSRPGAPYGHNPQRVFEAGFLAGIAERAAVAKCDCKREEADTS